MIKKLQAKGDSGKEEIFQRVVFGRAESHEIKDDFLRMIQEAMCDFESLWADNERNDKGMSISRNKISLMEEISRIEMIQEISLLKGINQAFKMNPVGRHKSSFQDELQIVQSEGTIFECSRVVTNINSSASGLPPQRTRSVRRGISHKHGSAVTHPSELAPE